LCALSTDDGDQAIPVTQTIPSTQAMSSRRAAQDEKPKRRPARGTVLISRINRIDGDWVVDDAPITLEKDDPACAQALRYAKAWRAEDPENRRYVIDELSF
jgi:hypothetical protein